MSLCKHENVKVRKNTRGLEDNWLYYVECLDCGLESRGARTEDLARERWDRELKREEADEKEELARQRGQRHDMELVFRPACIALNRVGEALEMLAVAEVLRDKLNKAGFAAIDRDNVDLVYDALFGKDRTAKKAKVLEFLKKEGLDCYRSQDAQVVGLPYLQALERLAAACSSVVGDCPNAPGYPGGACKECARACICEAVQELDRLEDEERLK